ncbi:autotransporter outer membrane beta-barrel domain-containing protein [Paraburkholderia humisilvae]|uniref:Autotransporter domain-containing protein n=1 Tax=Paraburkholderia humisilvae TaxID=627669 RepID=A0A6J5D8F5_9BURK|nr:autotransporter outer membrane beta-barrel domain-containing protein [Paraburkholderia humisilvae]CAB3749016.1 hypothetical protein LMG29542_00831 [Paraburkholderia humisilvae]
MQTTQSRLYSPHAQPHFAKLRTMPPGSVRPFHALALILPATDAIANSTVDPNPADSAIVAEAGVTAGVSGATRAPHRGRGTTISNAVWTVLFDPSLEPTSGALNLRLTTANPCVRILSTSSLAASLLLGSGSNSAFAADECGAASGNPPSVTCTSAGNPYGSGILYNVGAPGLTLNAQGIAMDSMSNVGPGGLVVTETGTSTGPVTINLTGTNSIKALTSLATYGIGVTQAIGVASVSDVTVNATANINVTGLEDVRGVFVNNGVPNSAANLSIVFKGDVQIQANTTAAGVHARSASGAGNVSVDVSGNVTGAIQIARGGLVGIFAEPNVLGGTGNATVNYHSGTLTITGPGSNGIYAFNRGSGSADLTTDPGTVVVVTGGPGESPGSAISAQSWEGLAADGASVVATVASQILHIGETGDPRAAIKAYSGQDAPITVTYTGPGMTTEGDNGMGIFAQSGRGTVLINSSGPITTSGATSFGIRADSGTLSRAVLPANPQQDPPDVTGGLTGPSGIGGTVTVNATAPIKTSGIESHGIWATSATGAVNVTATSVTTTGEFTSGIAANGASTTVTVASGGTVMGGWQPGMSGVGPSTGLPAAGVVLGSSVGPAVLINNGTIGALSDRVVSGDPQIVNNGSMTGFVQLTTGVNSFVNNGTFNLRNFADTNGDGVRDTLRVAGSDLGSGTNNAFTNNGIVALQPNPSGATTFDTTGQYLPLGNTANAMAVNGPVQGQILGVKTFINSGTIDLQANPVAGDVLVISGGHTPGTNGGGQFVSNGGLLRVDTVLNAGGAATRSDTLVVDGTAVGANGATKIAVQNVGGQGALTANNGIMVVQVLDPSRSANGAFSLAGRAVAGAYEYQLLQGGVQDPDGNWYLRSEQTPPPNPEPGPEPTPPEPLYRPEVAAYLANQHLAGQMFVESLHDRLGEPQYVEGQGFDPQQDKPRSVWLRVVGNWEGSHSQDNNFQISSDTFLLEGGAELAKWKVLSEADRIHAGLTFTYGYSHSDASAAGNPASARGIVEGYIVGAYGTWFQNDKDKLGAYVDTWVKYGWFNNQVQGDELPTVKYDAHGWAISGELGYAVLLPHDWVVEPQGQIIYVGYNENNITEQNGTNVTGANSNGVITRLGVRTDRTFIRDDGRKVQPYVTLNWWHTTANSSVSFNQLPIGSLYPANRYEVKLGLNTDLGKGWTGWANVAGAWGEQSYHDYTARVGAKYTW